MDARSWPSGHGVPVPELVHAEVALSTDGTVVAALAVRDDDAASPGELLVRWLDRSRPDLTLVVSDLLPDTLAVSPDGRWLAYGHRSSGADSAGRTRVVDLGDVGSTGADLSGTCFGRVAFTPATDPGRPVILCPRGHGTLARLTPDGAPAGETLSTDCSDGRAPVVAPDGTAVACLGVTAASGGRLQPAVWVASLRSATRPTVVLTGTQQADQLSWSTGSDHVVVGSADVPFSVFAWSG